MRKTFLSAAVILWAGSSHAAAPFTSFFESPAGQQAVRQGLSALQQAWSGYQKLPAEERTRLQTQLREAVARQLGLDPRDLDILNPDDPFFGNNMTLTVDRRTGTAYLIGDNGASASFSARDNIFTGVVTDRHGVPRTLVVLREGDGYAGYLDTQRLDATGTANPADGTLNIVATGPGGQPLAIRREADGSFTVNGRPPDASLVTGSALPG